MGKLKFKRGDLIAHDIYAELRGVVIQTKHLEVELDEGKSRTMLHYHVWWNDNSHTYEPPRDIRLVESK